MQLKSKWCTLEWDGRDVCYCTKQPPLLQQSLPLPSFPITGLLFFDMLWVGHFHVAAAQMSPVKAPRQVQHWATPEHCSPWRGSAAALLLLLQLLPPPPAFLSLLQGKKEKKSHLHGEHHPYRQQEPGWGNCLLWISQQKQPGIQDQELQQMCCHHSSTPLWSWCLFTSSENKKLIHKQFQSNISEVLLIFVCSFDSDLKTKLDNPINRNNQWFKIQGSQSTLQKIIKLITFIGDKCQYYSIFYSRVEINIG